MVPQTLHILCTFNGYVDREAALNKTCMNLGLYDEFIKLLKFSNLLLTFCSILTLRNV